MGQVANKIALVKKALADRDAQIAAGKAAIDEANTKIRELQVSAEKQRVDLETARATNTQQAEALSAKDAAIQQLTGQINELKANAMDAEDVAALADPELNGLLDIQVQTVTVQ